MHALFRTLLASALALLAAGPLQAQADATKPEGANPPAGFVAPAEPRPDESQAQRTKSQPGNNAPFWRGVRESGQQPGLSNLPGAEQGVLIQPFVQYPGSRLTNAGEAWRQVRNRWIIPYGGALVLITALALAIFYWRRGPMGGHIPDTGRVVERFTPFERSAHWANAGAFSILAISGLVMAFGKFFLLPVIGATLFGWLTYGLKNLHNFAGPVFAVSLVIVILTFVRDNLPAAGDLKWLLRFGGLFGKEEIPSPRFNAAEKLVFWAGVFVLGGVVVGSGLYMDKLLPGMDYLRTDMQVAHMIHASAALLMVAMFLGHIYLGTLGTRGALAGMRTGYVDEAWGDEHHKLWIEDIRAGRVPAQRSTEPRPAHLTTAGGTR
ncbi:MAG: formate dehydrogenase subunit gamma [Burkholderiales bacterium]|nr:formate dehydrogenase subunit gamma [Burkholderiales bacterium]